MMDKNLYKVALTLDARVPYKGMTCFAMLSARQLRLEWIEGDPSTLPGAEVEGYLEIGLDSDVGPSGKKAGPCGGELRPCTFRFGDIIDAY